MAEAAVTAEPAMGAAWVTLGQALKTSQRTAEAGAAYREALRLDGMDALARMGLGELKIAMERPEEALRDYELALRRKPALVAAHFGMGHALSCCEGMTRRCSDTKMRCSFSPGSRRPSLPPALRWRGSSNREAEARYRRALVLRPDFAAAWMNLGCLLREQGRDLYAEAALRRAVESAPRPGLRLGQPGPAGARTATIPAEAEAHLRKAFELNPDAGGDAYGVVPVPRRRAGPGRRMGLAALGAGAQSGPTTKP